MDNIKEKLFKHGIFVYGVTEGKLFQSPTRHIDAFLVNRTNGKVTSVAFDMNPKQKESLYWVQVKDHDGEPTGIMTVLAQYWGIVGKDKLALVPVADVKHLMIEKKYAAVKKVDSGVWVGFEMKELLKLPTIKLI